MLVRRREGVLPFFFAISALIFIWAIAKSRTIESRFSNLYDSYNINLSSKKSLKLHLLIPATSANPNFCRTTLSAALLDYPTPIIVNWEAKEDDKNLYASHLAKIDGILDYLRGLPSRNDNDLVLIVDGFDVWFQLRPEVLIQRYQDVIRERTRELESRFDSGMLERRRIKQTVILGADKKCWPQDMKYPACYAVPPSPLSKDMFGESTDAEGVHSVARPSWLNSGTVLGPTTEVKELFEATKRRVEEHFHGYSDQWYIGELFGDQEFQRDAFSKHPERSLIEGKDVLEPRIEGDQDTELHMTLDYDASLFHTNSFAHNDVAWVVFNSTTFPENFSDANKTKFGWKQGSTLVLPTDIANSRPPIAKGVVDDELFDDNIPNDLGELPYNTTWNDVPLMVNMATGTVPVIIHLNGKKEKIDEWWSKLWWYQGGWGEHLLLSGSRAGAGPLGTTTDPDTGEVTTWWKGAYNSRRGENSGYWSSKGKWLYYNLICIQHREVLYEGKQVGFKKEWTDWKGPKDGITNFDHYEGEPTPP